ncbi:MAG: hypothetical protein ACI4JS_02765 [Oscillospiraceae bacterium]
MSKKCTNRLARKVQMLGSGTTARLCAYRGAADDADVPLLPV